MAQKDRVSLSSTALLLLISSISVISGQSSGVHLSLNGVTVPNEGYVLASNIGGGNNALLCNTIRSDCCRGGDHPNGIAQGHWYRPDGTEVVSFTAENMADSTNNFFSRDRGTGIVRLNRNGDPLQSQRGHFRCVIPDVNGMDVTLYVNIVDMIPTTQPPPPTTQPPMTTTTQSPSTTQPPVTTTSQSPPPTTTQTATTIQPSTTAPPPDTTAPPPVTTVLLPPTTIVIMVSIEPSGDDTIGGSYMLVCSVTVTGSTDTPTITWLDDGVEIPSADPTRIVSMTTGSPGSYSSTLMFNPLRASDAGTYTCRTILGSATDSASFDVTVRVPTPTVMLSSNTTADGMVFIGSAITLTCTVELSLAVDVPVTVNVQLSDPAGSLLTTTPPSVSGSTYSFSTTIQMISFTPSGVYTCIASVSSTSPFLTASQTQTRRITIVVAVPPPVNVQATQSSSSAPVELSWSPPSDGAATITGYRIFFGDGQNISVPAFVRMIGSVLGGNIDQMIAIRSESALLFSELINITVTVAEPRTVAMCSNNTSVALGVVILLIILITTAVIAGLSFALLRRRPLTVKEQSKVSDDLSVSANVAYGQVKMAESSTLPDVYEELGALAGGGATDYATCAAGIQATPTLKTR